MHRSANQQIKDCDVFHNFSICKLSWHVSPAAPEDCTTFCSRRFSNSLLRSYLDPIFVPSRFLSGSLARTASILADHMLFIKGRFASSCSLISSSNRSSSLAAWLSANDGASSNNSQKTPYSDYSSFAAANRPIDCRRDGPDPFGHIASREERE